MKKIFSGILVLLLAVAMFADSKDCVDGIIEVADSGKFPSGHFGQAAGYLPGDSVFVTNPESGVTLQFLNLGTLDSADGIVILLSDESAKTLGVKKGSGMRCKLNMRYGGFDETVTGQAVIDAEDAALARKITEKEPAAPAKEPEAVSPAVETVAEPAPVQEVPAVAAAPVAGVPLFEEETAADEENTDEIIEEIAEEETVPEEIVAAPAEETIDPAEETRDAEEPVAEEIVEEEPVAETAVEETVEEEMIAETPAAVVEEDPVAEEDVEEEPIEDYENENAAFAETVEAVEQPSPAEASEAEELAVEEEPVEEETVEEEAVEEEAVAEEVLAEEPAEIHSIEPVAEEIEEDETPVASEAVEEELPALAEEIPAEPEAVAEETVPEVSDEPVVEETVEDEYAPIVLVPAEPLAPESTEEVAEETRAIEPVAEEEKVVEDVAETSAPAAEPVTVAEVRAAEPASYKDLIVASEDDLKKGCWYVQIASLGNAENLERTVRKYSKYPMVLVPNGKVAYRVLVGPLGMDEYAAVLAKFKEFGYKDAFLKKK